MAKADKTKKSDKKKKAGAEKAGKKALKAGKGANKGAKAAAVATPAAPAKAALPRAPLAPEAFPDLPVIAGAEFAVAAAGVRYPGRTDVMLARFAPGTAMAGVFTRSATRAAPVRDCEAKLARRAPEGAGAAIVINSGNANAFTGAAGEQAVKAIAVATAAATGVAEERVFTCSTGVIGEPLPDTRITAVMEGLCQKLAPGAMPKAARAIMTTDTFPKGAAARVDLGGHTVQIAGVAKGSGMIAPDMATMLGVIATDARIAPALLQRMLRRLTDETFNAITVDGDTSTSDSVLLAATGQASAPEITDLRSKPARAFAEALHGVMQDLALQIVRDGEGATKLVEVTITGAASTADARRVASAIANSPLVKTAIAGEDPNWGRIVMAVGKSGAEADRDRLAISFGAVRVAENGAVAPGYSEAAGAAVMKGSEIPITVDLGLGRGRARMWTCDFTHGYIDINADYRS